MKYFILPLALIFSMTLKTQTVIHGKINNLNNLNDTLFKVVFIQNKVRMDSTVSQAAGFYSKEIKSGLYDIELSKKLHTPIVLKAMFINTGKTSINFSVRFIMPQLSVKPITPATKIAEEPVVYDSGKKADDVRSFAGVSLTAKKPVVHMSMSSSTTAVSAVTKKTSSHKDKAKKTKASTPTPEMKSVGKFETMGMDAEGMEDITAYENKSAIKAGQVTAGHWRDIDHWSEWLNTNKDEATSRFQKVWGYYPHQLMKVSFEDKNKKALAFTSVTLLDKNDQILWQTKTDQDGQAWFWPNLHQTSQLHADKIKIKQGVHEKTIQNIQSYINSKNKVRVDFTHNNTHQLEIGFIVDATGSMGDEIKFLQVELMDVINRVQKKNRCLQIQTGAVFYKDKGDEYLTRVLPLSDNPANTINFIGNQSANGGGDFPEAVDMAMQDAIEKLQWSSADNPKIMFLLLDAPPHQDSASKERMRLYTRKAAEKGIRIVPIAASGIDKTTEFLLKYMAISTNGEYLYITDDSKIGDTHLKPTGGESKVDYLNDLMVDLINRYSEGKWCKEDTQTDSSSQNIYSDSIRQIDSSQQQKNTDVIVGNNWYMKFFPNPAAHIVQLNFSEVAERIRITDISGKVMYEFENREQTGLSIDISSWNTGVYLVYAVRKDETISGKLLVMH